MSLGELHVHLRRLTKNHGAVVLREGYTIAIIRTDTTDQFSHLPKSITNLQMLYTQFHIKKEKLGSLLRMELTA